MGTITPRKRKDGSTGYTAQVRIKRGGKVVHTEAETFERRAAAAAWLKKRETALAEPGGLDAAKRPSATLAQVIDQYVKESRREIGRTKAQVLATIKTFDIGAMDCPAIGSTDIVAFGQELLKGGRQPQTVANYMSHLQSVFAVARPAWGYELDAKAIEDALVVLRRLGVISKSRKRDRRPTLEELDRILTHFVDARKRAPQSIPMDRIVGFALFSTRRQEEITRVGWSDLDVAGKRLMVRDMKHPGEKVGNDMWCELPAEALKIALAMPRKKEAIFPYNAETISARFTRACALLEIDDLHFHDLRHEGVSRLFEMGKTIPQAASVSGHRSWQSLERYTHLRQTGDKYARWKWLPLLTRKLKP